MKKTILALSIALILPVVCFADTVPVKIYNTTNGSMSISYKLYNSNNLSSYTLSIPAMASTSVDVDSNQGVEVILAQSSVKNKDGSTQTVYSNFQTYSCLAQAGSSQHQAVIIFRPLPSENFLACGRIGDNFQN